MNQKVKHNARNRANQSKSFHIGDIVLLKNFCTIGLQEKYIGLYVIVDVKDAVYEIESLEDKRQKIVHFNALKPFKMDYKVTGVQRDDRGPMSEESETEETLFDLYEPVHTNTERRVELEANRSYNLRQYRRAPERYGVPLRDF